MEGRRSRVRRSRVRRSRVRRLSRAARGWTARRARRGAGTRRGARVPAVGGQALKRREGADALVVLLDALERLEVQ